MQYAYSFIVPVYNRPEEVRELLESLAQLDFDKDFEVVIVEDGSKLTAKEVVAAFPQLHISYYFKENTGPGPSRNYGMERAQSDYFLILDSDCVLPSHYLKAVDYELQESFVHCFGGPDDAHPDFSALQQAINFSMTSFLTTGGVRGGSRSLSRFQPRSFNMGLSREAFTQSGGFGKIHPGEDPELTFKLWELGYETRLFPNAYVYHKRRLSWSKFYTQVHKFGLVRPILNQRYPAFAKATFWLPTLALLFTLLSLLLLVAGWWWPITLLIGYLTAIFLVAWMQTKSWTTAVLALRAVGVQFYGYGTGYLTSWWALHILKQHPEERFPHLFFD
ncbi:glycosyltransferase [Croceiramulus getboli]|nr:glycosyltransferase [Flavobacteriaceae bacterium YJPT1-3]